MTNVIANNISRQLVTSWSGGTPLDGFTIVLNDTGLWEVSDGRITVTFEEPDYEDVVLRTYAEFIIGRLAAQDVETQVVWLAEIDEALSDANAIKRARDENSFATRDEAIDHFIVKQIEHYRNLDEAARESHDVDAIADEAIRENRDGRFTLAPGFSIGRRRKPGEPDDATQSIEMRTFWNLVQRNERNPRWSYTIQRNAKGEDVWYYRDAGK